MVILECPYPLLGRDLLTKMGAQIHFLLEGLTIWGPRREPVQVLTLRLEESKLFETNEEKPLDMAWWLQNFPQAWAETGGMGKVTQQPPIHMELKAMAIQILVHQYPMP